MSTVPGTQGISSRGRTIFASAVVVLTVFGVWKFIDYRTEPPPPPAVAAPR